MFELSVTGSEGQEPMAGAAEENGAIPLVDIEGLDEIRARMVVFDGQREMVRVLIGCECLLVLCVRSIFFPKNVCVPYKTVF